MANTPAFPLDTRIYVTCHVMSDETCCQQSDLLISLIFSYESHLSCCSNLPWRCPALSKLAHRALCHPVPSNRERLKTCFFSFLSFPSDYLEKQHSWHLICGVRRKTVHQWFSVIAWNVEWVKIKVLYTKSLKAIWAFWKGTCHIYIHCCCMPIFPQFFF